MTAHLDPFAVRALLGPRASVCRRALVGTHGVGLPPFVDHHVHLHLIDEHGLAPHGIAAVVDLGGEPAKLARRLRTAMPEVAHAGAFLAAPGGYPSGRSWAPEGMVHEVSSDDSAPGVVGGAASAVDAQVEFGASVIKVSLNSAGGPVLSLPVLRAVVRRAHERSRPVVAHVQGEGMTRLALDGGVDVLAHTPFDERVPEELIERAVSAGQAWISTLAIHANGPGDDRAVAVTNLAAFAAAGGRVLYGTDLGNGDLPVGVNADELAGLAAARLDPPAVITALTDPWPNRLPVHGVATFVPGSPPGAHADLAAWLATATVVPTEELVQDDV